jgi:hypothetical protein
LSSHPPRTSECWKRWPHPTRGSRPRFGDNTQGVEDRRAALSLTAGSTRSVDPEPVRRGTPRGTQSACGWSRTRVQGVEISRSLAPRGRAVEARVVGPSAGAAGASVRA